MILILGPSNFLRSSMTCHFSWILPRVPTLFHSNCSKITRMICGFKITRMFCAEKHAGTVIILKVKKYLLRWRHYRTGRFWSEACILIIRHAEAFSEAVWKMKNKINTDTRYLITISDTKRT